jgi:predicted dinucleotide-binding enzyme
MRASFPIFVIQNLSPMKIAVFGTGNVGDTIGSKLVALGHEVTMGSRTKDHVKALAFVEKHQGKAAQGTFDEAAAEADCIFNCTAGAGSIQALASVSPQHLQNKLLIDLANPLDFSSGLPPTLSICNSWSLAEEIQKNFPQLKVVKTLNTMWCGLMVNPGMIGGGEHQVFLSGNDAEAKARTREILMSFGWKEDYILDLGDLSTARGTEMLLPLWLRIWGATKNGAFNFKIVS